MGIFVVACQSNPEQNFASQSSATETENCRVVEHDAGEIEICGQPQTVAALSPRVLDPMLALGVQPAAYAEGRLLNFDRFDNPSEQIPYLGDLITTQPINLGDRLNPSLETLVKVKPDLIVGTDFRDYDLFSKIAPTLVVANAASPDGWSRRLQVIAQVFGKEERSEQVIAEYEQYLAEVQEKLAPILATNPRVLPIYPHQGGTIGVESYTSDAAALLEAVGFQLVLLDEFPQRTLDVRPQISVETLPQLDPDMIFVLSVDGDNFYDPKPAAQRLWNDNPVLKNLRASQERHVYFVNSRIWGGRLSGPIAYGHMLDELPDLLLPLVEEK
ncbi:MAG: iron-siderophore ABC transporter substrate-binding protein [Leptolyngbya sp. SIO4C5]|nr:iron-siderophore ABC transporter substrate-binding protein [Leptolyngbya sp. SIO4C5]